MNLYRISQCVNNTWDTYDSAIVAALGEEQARRIHLGGTMIWSDARKKWVYPSDGSDGYVGDWVAADDRVTVELIGTAAPGTEAGVILASFNAG